jgi:hypothetical protein
MPANASDRRDHQGARRLPGRERGSISRLAFLGFLSSTADQPFVSGELPGESEIIEGGNHPSEREPIVTSRVSPKSIIVLTVAFAVAAGGCDAATEPRAPIDAADLRAEASLLSDVLVGHVDAWMDHDTDAIRAYWDDETVHEDTGFLVEISGPELFGMPDGLLEDTPDFEWRVDRVFVSDGVALEVTRAWGIELRGRAFVEDDPLWEIDRIEVDPDRTLGRWTLFYDLGAYRDWNALDSRLEDAESIIDAYAHAWGTGDSTSIEALYAADARRVDTLFGVDLEGVDALTAHAEQFSSWLSDDVFTVTLIFSDSRLGFRDPERVGAVFTLESADADGSACDIGMAVILSSTDGAIIHDEVFWDADTLVECGWAA